MSAREFADRHGPASGQLLDIVVRSRHVAVLVVEHRAAEVLDDVGRDAHRLRARRSIPRSEGPGRRSCGQAPRRVPPPSARGPSRPGRRSGWSFRYARRGFQERRDGAALVVRRDRRMPALADRHAQDALLQVGQLPGIEQPFEEVGRPQMDDGQARPVEHLLGDEAVAAGVAGGVAVRRPLRQVDDGLTRPLPSRPGRNSPSAWIRPGWTGQTK